MVALPLELPREQIEAFCVRDNIRKLSLFGSVLRVGFQPSSDIDALVEFDPGQVPGYFGCPRWSWNYRVCWAGK